MTQVTGWDSTGGHSTDNTFGPDAQLPELLGTLVIDGGVVDNAAGDLGRIVSHRPRAVLRPRVVEDIVKMVRFCYARSIPFAPQGTGHMTQGQRLVKDGLAIDMTTLSKVHGGAQRSSMSTPGCCGRISCAYSPGSATGSRAA